MRHINNRKRRESTEYVAGVSAFSGDKYCENKNCGESIIRLGVDVFPASLCAR